MISSVDETYGYGTEGMRWNGKRINMTGTGADTILMLPRRLQGEKTEAYHHNRQYDNTGIEYLQIGITPRGIFIPVSFLHITLESWKHLSLRSKDLTT